MIPQPRSLNIRRIEIFLNKNSRHILYEDVISANTKGGMYCVLSRIDGGIECDQYPICSIFRVTISYERSKR